MDVFSPSQPSLAKHLHPLVSIELSAIDPQWSGRMHLLNPIEPDDAYMADHTVAFHNEYTRENWISFRLNEDDRY